MTAPDPVPGSAASLAGLAAALREGLDASRRSPGDWIVAFEQVHDRAEAVCDLLLGPRPRVPVRDEPQA